MNSDTSTKMQDNTCLAWCREYAGMTEGILECLKNGATGAISELLARREALLKELPRHRLPPEGSRERKEFDSQLVKIRKMEETVRQTIHTQKEQAFRDMAQARRAGKGEKNSYNNNTLSASRFIDVRK